MARQQIARSPFQEMMDVNKARFIAGAVCPRCSAMDKIVVDPQTDTRRCVSCGFADDRPADKGPDQEVVTRVSRGSARRIDTPAQTIKIVDA